MSDERDGYRAPQVAKAGGVSYRMLDHWTTSGLVVPSVRDAEGSGSQRLYSFDDILLVRTIKNLRDAGVSLQRIRKAVDQLRAEGTSLRDVTLVADANRVYAVSDMTEAFEIASSGQGVFLIALGKVTADLEAEVASLPTERADPQVRGRFGVRRAV